MPLRFYSAFLDPHTVIALTGFSDYKLETLLDTGSILALHVETPDVSKQLLRLSADSLLCHLDGQPPPDLDTIINRVFPEGYAPTAIQVSRQLLVGPDHILELMRSNILRPVPGTHCRSGNGGSPKLNRSSVLAFLRSRRLN